MQRLILWMWNIEQRLLGWLMERNRAYVAYWIMLPQNKFLAEQISDSVATIDTHGVLDRIESLGLITVRRPNGKADRLN